MLLIIDNYDSFTYNIYQILAAAGHAMQVVTNDEKTLPQLIALRPSRLLVSPGPGDPNSAGISLAAIAHFAGRIPVLGVCLGHQALAQAFGGHVVRAQHLMHGKTSPMHHDQKTLFVGMPQPFAATRYHSLIVERATLPKTFTISAWTAEQEIMGLRHTPTGAEGVQFHPESIISESGALLLQNFCKT